MPDWYQRAVVSELVSGNYMGAAGSLCVTSRATGMVVANMTGRAA